MVGRCLRIFSLMLVSGPVLLGCLPEDTLTADEITVQVPTGDGQAELIDNSEWLNAEPPDTTPYGPFDASGINVSALYNHNSGTGGGGNNATAGGSDDYGTTSAALLVSGAVQYSGGVSGMDHQILEGGYPEIHKSATDFATVGTRSEE